MTRTATRLALLVALAGALAGASSAQATLTIDSFSNTTATWPLVDITTGGGAESRDESPLGGVIGGRRQTFVQLQAFTAPPSSGKVEATIYGGVDSIFQFASNNNSDGLSELFYQGSSGDLGANLVLNGENAFVIRVVNYDGAGAPLVITLTLNDGTTTASKIVNVNSQIVVPTQLVFNYNAPEFVGLDFTSINTIRVGFNGGNAADYTFDYLESQVVPEPGTLAAGILGLLLPLGLGFNRRFRMSA